MHVVKVEVELVIEPGQAACEAGIWNETRYYLVCGEPPDPGIAAISVNERVYRTGVEFLTFEAAHRMPDGVDPEHPWCRWLHAQVRSTSRAAHGQ